MTKRIFPIDEVITCATGKLVAKRHMDAVYDLLNYMTSDNLFTHQLPRAMDECKPYLMTACPQMGQLDFDFLDRLLRCGEHLDQLLRCGEQIGESRKVSCHIWVEQEKQRLGLPDMVEVSPIPKDDHDVIDPIDELRTMRPDAEIIIVKMEEEA